MYGTELQGYLSGLLLYLCARELACPGQPTGQKLGWDAAVHSEYQQHH